MSGRKRDNHDVSTFKTDQSMRAQSCMRIVSGLAGFHRDEESHMLLRNFRELTKERLSDAVPTRFLGDKQVLKLCGVLRS